MLKKITEMWPNLLKKGGVDSDEGDAEEHDDLGVEEGEITENYCHLFWTRLMAIGDYQRYEERRWPLVPDIIEEC